MCVYSPDLLKDELAKLKALDNRVAEFVLATHGNERPFWVVIMKEQARYVQLKTPERTIIDLVETFVANHDSDDILVAIKTKP
jgi:hypothetical protein